MKAICLPAYKVPPFREFEKKLIVDLILHDTLVFNPLPLYGFLVFKLHGPLANECGKLWARSGCKSAVDYLDDSYNNALSYYINRVSDPDVAAALLCVGGMHGASALSEILNVAHPVEIFSRLRSFFDSLSLPIFEVPYTLEQFSSLVKEIDEKTGWKALQFEKDSYEFVLKRKTMGEAHCIFALARSQLLSPHGYNLTVSEPEVALRGYSSVFKMLIESVKMQDMRLYKQLCKRYLADEVLKYLLEERAGSMSRLIGFEPLDPMKLLKGLPRPDKDLDKAIEARKHVDEAVLRIRKKVERFRKLVERIHDKCLKGEVEAAADSKKELMDKEPNVAINQSIFMTLNQFSTEKVRKKLEADLKRELKWKERIERPSRICGKVRWLISGIPIIANRLGLADNLLKALDGVISTQIGPGVPLTRGLPMIAEALWFTVPAARILKSAIPVLPGFDIYAAFHKWPKVS